MIWAARKMIARILKRFLIQYYDRMGDSQWNKEQAIFIKNEKEWLNDLQSR